MKRLIIQLAIIVLVTGLMSAMGFASTITDPCPIITQDLIADQDLVVGKVEVICDKSYDEVSEEWGGNLIVKFEAAPGWLLMSTHLAVEDCLSEIPTTRGGKNPQVGKFPYQNKYDYASYVNEEWQCTTDEAVSVDSYQIPLSSLDKFNPVTGLFDSSVGCDTNPFVYIAAHAVVTPALGYVADLSEIPTALSDLSGDDGLVHMKVAWPGGDSYFNTTIVEPDFIAPDAVLGPFDGYCVDIGRTITPKRDYCARLYSSYDTIPAGLVDKPENLDLVNWIINQDFFGKDIQDLFPGSLCSGLVTYGDIQRAIWEVIDNSQSTAGLGSWNQCRVEEIVYAAESNGEGYEPDCDGVVAIILEPVNCSSPNGPTAQVTIAQVTLSEIENVCSPNYDCTVTETAWGDGTMFKQSKSSWAMYFTFGVIETNCNDEIDNDGDGLIDCADDDCDEDPGCDQ